MLPPNVSPLPRLQGEQDASGLPQEPKRRITPADITAVVNETIKVSKDEALQTKEEANRSMNVRSKALEASVHGGPYESSASLELGNLMAEYKSLEHREQSGPDTPYLHLSTESKPSNMPQAKGLGSLGADDLQTSLENQKGEMMSGYTEHVPWLRGEFDRLVAAAAAELPGSSKMRDDRIRSFVTQPGNDVELLQQLKFWPKYLYRITDSSKNSLMVDKLLTTSPVSTLAGKLSTVALCKALEELAKEADNTSPRIPTTQLLDRTRKHLSMQQSTTTVSEEESDEVSRPCSSSGLAQDGVPSLGVAQPQDEGLQKFEEQIRLVDGAAIVTKIRQTGIFKTLQYRDSSPENGKAERLEGCEDWEESLSISKDQLAEKDDWGPEDVNLDDDDDASETLSYAASLFSVVSLASSGSNLSVHSSYTPTQIATATKELFDIFHRDPDLDNLYYRAIHNPEIGPDRLQRNLRRLFQAYAKNLEDEHTENLEYLASKLVAMKARVLARSIAEKYGHAPVEEQADIHRTADESSEDETQPQLVDEKIFEDLKAFR